MVKGVGTEGRSRAHAVRQARDVLHVEGHLGFEVWPALLNADVQGMTVSLAGVRSMDSAGVGLMLSVRDRGGKVAACSEAARSLLALARFCGECRNCAHPPIEVPRWPER